VCGIGVIVDRGQPVSDAVAAAICDALRHRGPDGQTVKRIGPATLVHARLAIIDLAGGDQPLVSEDGSLHLIANGEIYNHLDLRAQLEQRGHRFATHSDCEVIVHAYEEWGDSCVERLNGIFGMAIWDEPRQRLFVARDPFGVKPIYWFRDGDRIGVASEIKPFLDAGLVSAELDPIALEHFLAWRYTPAPRTMFQGVNKLAAATTLSYQDGELRIAGYRRPVGAPAGAGPDELADELASHFTAAVGRQMMSDVPYGAFLSGGVDSVAIAAAMRRAVDEPPLTFTIGFPGHGDEIDERAAAASAAAAIGTDHHATAMVEGDFPRELESCVHHLEEPTGSASAPAAFQLSRFAAEYVKVVLSGQGADEPLGGYERHQAGSVLGLTSAVPSVLRAPAIAMAEALPRNERAKRAARLLDSPPGIERVLRIFEITDRDTRTGLTGGRAAAEAAAERARLADEVLVSLGDRQDPLSQVLYLDTHLFLPDSLLLYGDKTSMASSLEQRVPFLDLELTDFVERIPAKLRVRGLKRKWLYRRAVDQLVPAETLQRRKHPFATPYDDWLRTSLDSEVRDLYRPGSALAEYVEPAEVARLADEHKRGRADHKRILYCLLELGYWHRLFVERRSLDA
jgi:asparagine synthase (glutamine-hydrolysing)